MKNVGASDSQFRMILTLILFIIAYFSEGTPRWLILAAAVLLFLTAFLRFCPVWFGLKINTHLHHKAR